MPLFAKKRIAQNALMAACERGDLAAAKKAMGEGADPLDQSSSRGETALMAAAMNNHAEIVKWLAGFGGVDLRDGLGMSALMRASMQGSERSLGELLPLANASIRDFKGQDALMLAAAFGHAGAAAALLEVCEAKAFDCAGRTALFHAAERRHEQCVRILLPESDANAVSEAGTALMAACGPGNKAFPLLLRACDAKVADMGGSTALMAAARFSNLGMFKALLAKSDIEARDGEGRTALLCAAEECAAGSDSREALGAKKISALVGAGADVGAKDEKGEGAALILGRGNATRGLEALFGAKSREAKDEDPETIGWAKDAMLGAVECKRVEASRWLFERFKGLAFAGQPVDFMARALEHRYSEGFVYEIAGHVDLSGVDARGRDVLMRMVEGGFYQAALKHLDAFDLERKDESGRTAFKLCSKMGTNHSNILAAEMGKRLAAIKERKALNRASGGMRKPTVSAASPKARSL
jgi:ankyrin repeat protein